MENDVGLFVLWAWDLSTFAKWVVLPEGVIVEQVEAEWNCGEELVICYGHANHISTHDGLQIHAIIIHGLFCDQLC